MISFWICVLFLSAVVCEDSPPVVKLSTGSVEGFFGKTVNGRDYNAFEGIPYATPPVGELRFQEAKPVQPWTGLWKAHTTFRCLQYDHLTPPGQNMVSGEEDCLYLNIYSPNLKPKKKMDVLVYIHGGAFMFNDGGMFGPQIILDKDVVFVTINYRVGPLGFLSTEDSLVPGNNGMRDQSLALNWIKNNIDKFGGNSNSITIMGMSAGGASVQTHYLISQSKGLFSKGISQSGCVLNPWVFMEEPLNKTKTLSFHVGCPTENNKEMVECLKTKPARQIVNAVKHFQPWLYNPFSPFAMVVDKWAKDPIFPEHPLVLLKKGHVQDLPWMISYTSAEGLYPASDFYFDQHLEYLDKKWNEIMPYVLHYNDAVSSHQMDKVSSEIRKEYLNNKVVNKQNFIYFVEALSDRLFLADIDKAGRLHAAAVESPVYSYYFNYRGAHSQSEFRIYSDENIGVSHADDTPYILKMDMDTLSTKVDRQMSKMMVNMVTSFMKNGKPDINHEWLPLSRNMNDPWVQLHIDNPKKAFLEKKTEIGNRKFWNSLPFAENENLFLMKEEL